MRSGVRAGCDGDVPAWASARVAGAGASWGTYETPVEPGCGAAGAGADVGAAIGPPNGEPVAVEAPPADMGAYPGFAAGAAPAGRAAAGAGCGADGAGWAAPYGAGGG
ncbi:hypothetical protein [Agromyces sp. LHK192]|uniref:hypothetical protein n=1 Tax=Agromyces sp. LHK192 TaxID=2498704 RepID=UPI000FDA61C5|nr:hypothetical protein [Agromyces sp. LHK192]